MASQSIDDIRYDLMTITGGNYTQEQEDKMVELIKQLITEECRLARIDELETSDVTGIPSWYTDYLDERLAVLKN